MLGRRVGSSFTHSLACRGISTDTPRRVVVTGIGWVTPMGNSVSGVYEKLLHGETGVRTIVDPLIVKHSLPVTVAASVGPISSSLVPARVRGVSSRFEHYAMLSARDALADAGLIEAAPENSEPGHDDEQGFTKVCPSLAHRAGVIIGSGIGDVEEISSAARALEQRGARRVSAYSLPKMLCNLAAGHVSILHGLMGPNHAPATACATGAHAIGDAYRFIKYGDADVMVAGGAESGVSTLALALFNQIHALSRSEDPATASQPFGAARSGFVMSEGACVLVLEDRARAIERGARIYAEVAGYGLSGDAHHVTSPPPDGRGAVLAMHAALRGARADPGEVGYLNAHATSTPLGDSAEAVALSSVFGVPLSEGLDAHLRSENTELFRPTGVDAPPASRGPAVSSSKGALGHMLGAAGAIEAALAVMAVHTDRAVPTVGGPIAKEFENLNILATNAPGIIPEDGQPAPTPASVPGASSGAIDVAMTNSFGFGGSNASLLFRKHQ